MYRVLRKECTIFKQLRIKFWKYLKNEINILYALFKTVVVNTLFERHLKIMQLLSSKFEETAYCKPRPQRTTMLHNYVFILRGTICLIYVKYIYFIRSFINF